MKRSLKRHLALLGLSAMVGMVGAQDEPVVPPVVAEEAVVRAGAFATALAASERAIPTV